MIIITTLPKKKKLPKKKRSKTPTFKEVERMVAKTKSPVYPAYVFGFFRHRNWCYPDGTKVKCLWDAVEYLTKLYYNTEKLPPIKSNKVEFKDEIISYEEQLKDSRWLIFREKVFKARGRKCEHCGSTIYLQVHHPKYRTGRKAWEYSTDEVVVLCRECHKKEHNIKD